MPPIRICLYISIELIGLNIACTFCMVKVYFLILALTNASPLAGTMKCQKPFSSHFNWEKR